MSAPRSSEQKLMASTMISDISSTDYGAYMRSSMSTTADLLLSIERDIQESRELIQTKNTDERVLTRLVSSLEEDNNILQARVQSLEEEVAHLHADSARVNNELFGEFEEKILACNGEIERVVAQCNDINNERQLLEEQLRQAETNYNVVNAELFDMRRLASEHAVQIDSLSNENAQFRHQLQQTSDEFVALQQLQQHTVEQLQQAQRAATAATEQQRRQQQEQQRLQQQLLLQEAELPPVIVAAAGGDSGGSSVNLYSDDDIASLLQRIKQLEEVNRQQMHQPNNGRTLLASPQRVQISPLPTSPAAITTSVTAAGSRATNSSGGSSGKSDGRSAARYESAASNHSFNSSAYPARSNSVPSPAAAVAQQQGSPIRATPLSSPRYLQQQQPQHQYYEQHQQHQAQQHSGTPNPDRVHYGAPVPTAAVSGPYGFSSHNSRGVGRQFESPESDEGQPYELEDLPFHSAHTSSTATSAAVTATTFAHVYGTNKATTAPFRAGSAGVGAGGAAVTANSTAVASPHHRESPHPASPFVAQSYVTDYTFPDDAAHSPFVQNNVAEPVYSAYSPGRLNVQEKHAPITLSPPAAAPATEQPAPLTASTSTSVREGSSSQMPAARVYHDFLRSSSEVMDAARRTLHNSRSKENKAAAASVAIRADPNKPTTASTTSVTNTSRSNGSSSYTSSTNNSNTNRVRFAPTPHFNTSEPAFSSQNAGIWDGNGDTFGTPLAKALPASCDYYDSQLLPPHQQESSHSPTHTDDDVPDYIAPYAYRDSGYGVIYSSATEYNPAEHSLLQGQVELQGQGQGGRPAIASPVILRNNTTTSTSNTSTSATAATSSSSSSFSSNRNNTQQRSEMPPFSPASPHSPRTFQDSSDPTQTDDFRHEGDMRREDQRANILAREDETEDGEDENYPDDFESYDDNVGGYLDDGDEGSFHAPYTELGYHYSAHNNDTRDSTLYNEAGYDEGGEAYEGDTNVMGADGDLEGSMSDNEMNNVFMYDGSSAVDLMAMQEQPFESYDLDELSRLDI